MRLCVASSGRGSLRTAIASALRDCGHEVYDLASSTLCSHGFKWHEIDVNWKSWSPQQQRAALQHPRTTRAYQLDIQALTRCDACVVILPSGISGAWQLGYALGQRKRGVIVQLEREEPELMFCRAEIVTSMSELFDLFGEPW